MEKHDVHYKKTKQKQKHKVFSASCILTKNYSSFVICGGEGRGALTNAAKLSYYKIYLLARITGNTEQCDKNSKGEDNIRRWRILLLREMVSKGRRRERKGCHETHEGERRESLGGAVVRIHFLGAGLNPGLFGEISLDVHITLGDCTCVLTWSPCRGRCRTRWGRCVRKSSRTESS